MCSDIAICADKLSKRYQIYDRPADRLKQFFSRARLHREFWALKDASFEVKRGEVIGIVGRNGSGKSTLLQLVCGTLAPSSGKVETNGRIAALLELGAGFNSEFTGRENVYLSAAILGLEKKEIDARFEEIVEFSGIRDFIDQPVKTYSSGMYVRLAFSVATCVDPDILVIDEALSVGDGEFSRKSFERIMKLKEAGKTILFCSHALYQIEALCDRAIWLDQGNVKLIADSSAVIVAYNAHIEAGEAESAAALPDGSAAVVKTTVTSDGKEGDLRARSGESTVAITVEFTFDPALPTPVVAVMFLDSTLRPVASASTKNDGLTISSISPGRGSVSAIYECIPLLKGIYWVDVFLLCEHAVHVYQHARMVAKLQVSQTGLEMGVVAMPHRWVGAS